MIPAYFNEKAFLLLPLVAVLTHGVAFLSLKRAMDLKVGPLQVIFLITLASGIIGLLALAFTGIDLSRPVLMAAALNGFLIFLGHMFGVFAFHRGDISIASPLFSMKTIFVAFFTVFLLKETVSFTLWIAAVLASVSLALLQISSGGQHKRVGLTIFYALLGASSYSLADVLLQKYGAELGPLPFVPMCYVGSAICALFLVPFFKKDAPLFPRPARRWLAQGIFFHATVVVFIGVAIGFFGHATEINIIFNLRGLWSIVLVWFVGHWFHNHERKIGGKIMLLRAMGAVLLLAAVALVLQP